MTTLDILDTLVGFDTTSANSNLALIAFVEEFLTTRGFHVVRVPDGTGEKAGLYCSYGPSTGADRDGILLSAHTDVVPVIGQEWTRDPFKLTREGDHLYGRGTTDMKGYLAAMLSAADRAVRMPLRAPLKLAISYDEEIGCVGIQHMIDQLAPAIGLPRVCFVGEPTSMQVATGHKGKAAFRAVCHGTSGHSALAPMFVNALHLAAEFIGELREVQTWLQTNGARDPAYGVPFSTVHVGTLSGGTALNIVPDRAEMVFEYRHLAADRSDDIRAQIMAAAAHVNGRFARIDESARIQVTQINAYPGLDVADATEIVTFAKSMAQTNATTKVAFGTEAGFFEAIGIPTVVCGPGSMEGQGHKADEFILVDQLRRCDAMLDLLLQSLVQPAELQM